MNQDILTEFGSSPIHRVENAICSLKNGNGVLILDDNNRENEGDIIFSAEKITVSQMALTIRHGSGIVCLCLTKERCKFLNLPMMVNNNQNRYRTAFTVTIEAARGITTGVSAKDRLTTIRSAIDDDAKPSDLNRPGHVFPLQAQENGVLSRRGHTEASIDLTILAGLKPASVICEITNDDGTMAKTKEIIKFGQNYNLPVLTVEDIVLYRKKIDKKNSSNN